MPSRQTSSSDGCAVVSGCIFLRGIAGSAPQANLLSGDPFVLDQCQTVPRNFPECAGALAAFGLPLARLMMYSGDRECVQAIGAVTATWGCWKHISSDAFDTGRFQSAVRIIARHVIPVMRHSFARHPGDNAKQCVTKSVVRPVFGMPRVLWMNQHERTGHSGRFFASLRIVHGILLGLHQQYDGMIEEIKLVKKWRWRRTIVVETTRVVRSCWRGAALTPLQCLRRSISAPTG